MRFKGDKVDSERKFQVIYHSSYSNISISLNKSFSYSILLLFIISLWQIEFKGGGQR